LHVDHNSANQPTGHRYRSSAVGIFFLTVSALHLFTIIVINLSVFCV